MIVLSVIVPTYNERESLPVLLERLAAAHRSIPLEVIIVDDASPDGTGALAESLGPEAGMPVTVIHRAAKSGLASAVIEGAAASRGRILTVMDADLSHPPELLPAFAAAIDAGAEIAVASRYVPGGGVARWPLWRKAASRGATWLARTVLSLPVRDPLSGFFALRRELLLDPTYLGLGYKLLLEILVRHPRRRSVEVPYRFIDRQLGQSKLAAGEIWAFLQLLVRLRREVGKLES